MKTCQNKILDPLTALYMQDSDEYDIPEDPAVVDEVLAYMKQAEHRRHVKNSANNWEV